MIIEMSTDTFMQAPGFRATHRAMKGENYQGLKSKHTLYTCVHWVWSP